MSRCPFCGMEEVKPQICPTCHHTKDYVFGDKFACGTINDEDDDGISWFRHHRCYESEITQLKGILKEMVEIFIFITDGDRLGCKRNGDTDCDCSSCQIFRLSAKILNRPEVKRIMEEKANETC